MKVKTIELTEEEFTEAGAKACHKLANDFLEGDDVDPMAVLQVMLLNAAFMALLKEMLFTED